MPGAWELKLLLPSACTPTARQSVAVRSIDVRATDLAKHSRGRRVVGQDQPLCRQPRGKAVVGSVAHCLGSINLKSTAQFEILHYQQFLSLIPSSEKQ